MTSQNDVRPEMMEGHLGGRIDKTRHVVPICSVVGSDVSYFRIATAMMFQGDKILKPSWKKWIK